jgi:hypothetical protein
MTGSVRRWRIAAGVGVLLALAVIGGMLIPPYFENMKFQLYLDDAVERATNPDVLRAQIVSRAAQMGLPVREGDVHITKAGGGVRVDILYVIRVDLPLYTVDLHFHPTAGG